MSVLSKYLYVTLVLFALSLFVSVSKASDKARACSSKQARTAEDVAGTARTWGQLQQLYKRFQHCDDGAIAEGFSESASKLFDKKWRDIPDFDGLSKTDPRFKRFVIRHIDETDPERLSRIEHNAKDLCPRTAEKLCSELVNVIAHLRRTE